MKKNIFLSLSLVFLSACSWLVPKYERPASPVPETWSDSYANAYGQSNNPENKPELNSFNSNIKSSTDIGWREFFQNKSLQNLISLALTNNKDLKIAVYNIEKARAMYNIQRSEFFPGIDAVGQALNQKTPQSISQTNEGYIGRQYSAKIAMSSYELDLFGRIASLNQEALNQYLATEEAKRSTEISLIAEVAIAVLNLVADREALMISQETLVNQQEVYNMMKHRFELGASSELDLQQVQTSLDTARVEIARYAGQVGRDLNALSVLVGVQITEERLKVWSLTEIAVPKQLPVNLPSEVLLKRPDIMQAEYYLQAKNANIGAARAAFFPRITLTTDLGVVNKDLNELFAAGTGTWSFVPQITLPIFHAGSLIANLKVSETDKKIAVEQYEKAIQVAFKEVSDALILQKSLNDQVAAQNSLVFAAKESYRLSEIRYNRGLDSFLIVLDSQRFMYRSELALILMNLETEVNMIRLYKALGGGLKEI